MYLAFVDGYCNKINASYNGQFIDALTGFMKKKRKEWPSTRQNSVFFFGMKFAPCNELIVKLNPIKCIWLLCVIYLSSISFAGHQFTQLPDLLKPAPYCDGKVKFDIAKESFVEIANELPGVQDYNELIKFYQKKEWAKYKTALAQYKKIYETTPLLEAVQFLEVQALFEQIDRTDYNDSSAAEKLFKQVVLLYPKSELVPILYASVASLWLNDGLVERALSYFEKLKKDYPFHPMYCYFQLGSGEANFLMHDYKSAKREFTQVRQKCTERKYLVGAQTRLNDIELRSQGDKFLEEYEKPFYSDVNMVNRFYPHVLYNLGELKFHKKEYESSKLFFSEYAKYGGRDPVCGPMSLKRLADIALLQNEDIKNVMGKYLSVKDQAPLTDIGRYSFVHAMLLQFNEVGEIEQLRRLKLIDDELEKIGSYDLRSLSYLEKGLALLSAGRKEALDYLVNLEDRTNYNLKKGPLAEFVRDEVIKFLEREANEKVAKTKRVDTLVDQSILEPYEKVYETWLKGTRYEERAKLFYEKIVLLRYEKSLEKKDGLSAVAKIARWKNSSLWNPKRLTKSTKKKIGDGLALCMKSLSDEDVKELSFNLKRYRKEMESVLNTEYHMLLVALDLPNTTKEEVVSHYKEMQKNRGLASLPTDMDKRVLSYLQRIKGKMYFVMGKYSEAEENLLKAFTDKDQKNTVEKELVTLYEKNKQYKKLFKHSISVFDSKPSEEYIHYLQTAKSAVEIGKLWEESSAVLKRAEKLGLTEKDIIAYKLLLARGSFETGKCKAAIESYQAVMKEELPAEEVPGSKFRLAKCLSITKNKEEALKLFEEVRAMNDSFWSPLASTEKNLLEIK